jgi:hypothetical protein
VPATARPTMSIMRSAQIAAGFGWGRRCDEGGELVRNGLHFDGGA